MSNDSTQVTKGVLGAIIIFILAFIGFCFLCCGIPTLIGWFTLT